ncbi:hypothetical protein [Clostridium saccharoperbutylacetonicum]|uniref:AbrB/MazE/SpoVT family DNA-binding domain-containing protein n=1 Tax=Clostridium saccharoperbutylacetonicum TaxID=36745 RepID=UPI0039EB9EDD
MKNKVVRKIGGSLYVVVTPYIAEKMKLKEGDEVETEYKRGQMIVKKMEGDK